jgi:hypothetical protein
VKLAQLLGQGQIKWAQGQTPAKNNTPLCAQPEQAENE